MILADRHGQEMKVFLLLIYMTSHEVRLINCVEVQGVNISREVR